MTGARTMGTDSCNTQGHRSVDPLVDGSHDLIARHQHAGGAYPAAPSFPTYRGYCWLRDGSFVAEGMSRYGDVASASAFHDWVLRVLVDRADQVARLVAVAQAGEQPPITHMLPTRFTIEGMDGTDEWWDFQTDGYGTWLWSVVEHARRHNLDLDRWRPAITIAASYVAEFWQRPCYDWWEEHVEQRHLSTLGALFGGLAAVASAGIVSPERCDQFQAVAQDIRTFALHQGVGGEPMHLTKWVGNPRMDAAVAACVVPFGLVEPSSPVGVATVNAVAEELDVDGGVHRFSADVFYGGGQWPLLSCLLGWNRAAQGDLDQARRYLRWAAAQATDAGELPEQSAGHLLHPDHQAGWVRRWGPVATPLLWSHGMYLIVATELCKEK